MQINKRVIILACPILIVILICIISLAISSFLSLPDLSEFISSEHINQSLKSKKRDIQFLDFSLEAGFQDNFKQLYTLKQFYNQIIQNNVKNDDVTIQESLYVNLKELMTNKIKEEQPDIWSRINVKEKNKMLQVTGWYGRDQNDIKDVLKVNDTQTYFVNHILAVLLKGLLSPFYLGYNQDSQFSGDQFHTTGIFYPKQDYSIFLPLPTDNMLNLMNTNKISTVYRSEDQCKVVSGGKFNFQHFCASNSPSFYIIRDYYSGGEDSGGISQKVGEDAVIYAQFKFDQKNQMLENSLIDKQIGKLFIVFDEELYLLSNKNNTIKHSTLLQQEFQDKYEGEEAIILKNKIKQSIKEIITQKKNSQINNNSNKYLLKPLQFDYTNNQVRYYCIVTPVEVYPGSDNINLHDHTSNSKTIFYLGYIVSESQLTQAFQETNSRLKNIELVSFGVICVISILSCCIVIRYSFMISYSFENPIINMTQIMNDINPESLDQESGQLENYEHYITSNEIKSLFEAMITLLNNFKYSNQRFHDDDALTLLEFSKAKKFYSYFGNQNGVGICSNNIGNIHLKHHRYLEAVSEYQEAILMAKIEHNEVILKMKKLKLIKCKKDIEKLKKLSNFNNSPHKQPRISSPKKKKTQLALSSSPIKKFNSTLFQQESAFIQKRQSQLKSKQNFNEMQENQDKKKEHGDNQNEVNMFIQNNSNLSDSNLVAQDLYMKFELSKTRLLNRKYQLAIALFEYSAQQNDNFYHEAIQLFDQCIELSITETQCKTNNIRLIIIYTKKAYCHLRLGEYKQAESDILQSRNIQSNMKHKMSDEEYSQYHNASLFLDIFVQIPPDILKSTIDMQEAILELSKFNFRNAAILLINIIEEGEVYDSQIRKYALQFLKNIMQKFNLNMKNLETKLQKFNLRTIELIMLIDYSKDMTEEQIKFSHLTCKNIFDKINNEDKISFVVFNEMVHQSFPLQEKSLYKDLLDKKFKTIILSPGGKSDLFKALYITTELFDSNQQINKLEENKANIKKKEIQLKLEDYKQQQLLQQQQYYNNQYQYLQLQQQKQYQQQLQQLQQQEQEQQQYTQDYLDNEKLRFICLFTEGNNQIKLEQLEQIRSLMQKKQVNLLIVNISNQNANMLYLRQLAKQISKLGQFFQAENDINEYLNKLREKHIKRQLICEYF